MEAPTRIVIENCRIVDGSGGASQSGSVAIAGATIESIGRVERRRAAERLDAEGLVLAPGFIDAHIHTDSVLLREPIHLASIHQGVTTHIVGQDGFGYAPTSGETFRFMAGYTSGINGYDLRLGPGSVADYLARFDGTTAVNIATLIPSGCVRMEVIGNAGASASKAEIEQMASLCRLGMDEGALGLSSGLDYVPSCHASTAELAHLASTVAAAGGVYVTHVRYRLGLAEALFEALEIGAQSGAPVHVSHLRGEDGIGSSELLHVVEAARRNGVDVTYDVYPYVRGSTFLPYLLPAWVFEGSVTDVLARLGDASLRVRLGEELADAVSGWSLFTLAGGLSGERARLEGLDLLAAAHVARSDPVSLVCDLLREEQFRVTLIVRATDEPAAEEDLLEMLRHPAHLVGSDGIFTSGLVHPRGHGTFAKFVGTLVRNGLLQLEDAVRRASAATAVRFGLVRRGLIRPGYAADLVLFDPEALRDRATYEQGSAPAVGVRDVFVNGVGVLRDGRPTGATPGRGLRRGRRGATFASDLDRQLPRPTSGRLLTIWEILERMARS